MRINAVDILPLETTEKSTTKKESTSSKATNIVSSSANVLPKVGLSESALNVVKKKAKKNLDDSDEFMVSLVFIS